MSDPFLKEYQDRQTNPFTSEINNRKANPPKTWKDYANQIIRSISQGVTLGFGDELAAAGDATIAKVANVFGVSPDTLMAGVREADAGKPWNEIYNQRLKAERQALSDFRDTNPVSAYGGEIGGAVVTGGGTAALGARAMGTVPTIAAAPAIAAGEGAIAGFGQGEDGVSERLANAGQAATVGGLLSLGLAGGGAALSGVTSRLADTNARAQRQVLRDLARDVRTPEGIAARLARSDKPLMPVDVAGENIRDLADAVITRGGQSAKRGARAISARQSRQPGRLIDDLDPVTPGGDYTRTVSELADARQLTARRQYAEETMAQVLESDDLAELLTQRPVYRRAFEDAARLREEFGGALENPFDGPVTTRAVDEIQKILRDRSKVGGFEGSLATAARNELLSLVDDLNPQYAAARTRFAADSRLMEAADMGDRFKRMKPDEIGAWLADRSDDEINMFRQKAVERIRLDVLNKRGTASDRVRVVVGTPYQREQLEAVFGSDWKTVQRRLIDEARISRTAGDTAANSRTARRQEKLSELDGLDQDVPGYAAQFAAEAGRQPLARTAVQGIARGGQAVVDLIGGFRPDVQDKVADILFEADKEKAVRKLTELWRRKEIDSRSAARVRQFMLTGAGAVGAGSAIGSSE